MAIYLSSLIRAIIAFHDLIDNKIQNRQNPEGKDKEKLIIVIFINETGSY